MKTIIYGLLLLILGSHWGCWAAANLPAVKEQVIDSAVLGEMRDLVIYLPADYQNSQDRYPVLYLTDGDI